MNHKLDPALHGAVLAALESAVNKALALDAACLKRLQELSDHTFHLACTSPEVDLYLAIEPEGVRLMSLWEGPVTTSVSGGASDFAELAGSSDPAAALINSGLSLHGDSAPLIRLQQILSELDMDWEAPLVDTLGDVAGHQLAQLVRGTLTWSKQAVKSLSRQLNEFIHEEARLSPGILELEDFYGDVQTLGVQLDRLESRCKRLHKRVTALRDRS